MDQAQRLREYMKNQQDQPVPAPQLARMVTITSGKGGVGKSNFTLNFALCLRSLGKRAIVLDLDYSTANLNILMGLSPRYNLMDVILGRKTVWEAMEKGTNGIEFISGGVDLSDLSVLDNHSLGHFWSQLEELQQQADYILFDTGAGISNNLVEFIAASDETIVVTTPEPTSIADSYAVIKTAVQAGEPAPFIRLVVNRARTYSEAVETSRAIKGACSRFLGTKIEALGFLMEDESVRSAVRMQTPFFVAHPGCQAARNITEIVYTFIPGIQQRPRQTAGFRGFFERILLRRSHPKGG